MNNMNEEVNIFPKIKADREGNTLKLNTTVRIKYRRKWYLREFNRNAYFPENENSFSAAISSFIRDIYTAQIRWKVETRLKDSDGNLVYPLDKDQREETERLKPLF